MQIGTRGGGEGKGWGEGEGEHGDEVVRQMSKIVPPGLFISPNLHCLQHIAVQSSQHFFRVSRAFVNFFPF